MTTSLKLIALYIFGISVTSFADVNNSDDHKLFFSSDDDGRIEARVMQNRKKINNVKAVRQSIADQCPHASSENGTLFVHDHAKEYVETKIQTNRKKMDRLIAFRKLQRERHLERKNNTFNK